MSKVRVVFLGTPAFAVTSLERMVKDEHFEIVGVVTQPDRPAGRKMVLTASPVKQFAQSHGLRVISPESVNQEVILQELQKWQAEVAVVVAFGQILSQKFLDLFPFGAVNVHGSVLPAWRGAAPIQRSVEAGEPETGVTLQKIVKQLDAGDILGIRRVPVPEEMTALELHDVLAQKGAELLEIELMDFVRGNLAPIPQDHSQATFAKKLDKSECALDWSKPAKAIHDKVRAFTMGPGTFTNIAGKKFKIHRTRIESNKGSGQAGVVLQDEKNLFVQTGQGVLEILEIQPENRNRMKASDLLVSGQIKKGDRFE